MQKYELTKEEKKKFNELFEIEKDIFGIYQKLAILETEGKKDTSEYTKMLGLLEYQRDNEDIIYNNYFDTAPKVYAILDYLNEENPEQAEKLGLLIELKIENALLYRFFCRTDYILANIPLDDDYEVDMELNEMLDNAADNMDEEEINDYNDDFISDDSEESYEYDDEYEESLFEKEMLLYRTIVNDSNRLLIAILDEIKNKPSNEDVRELLTCYKYIIAYCNFETEQEMIDSRFESSKKVSFVNKMISNYYDLDFENNKFTNQFGCALLNGSFNSFTNDVYSIFSDDSLKKYTIFVYSALNRLGSILVDKNAFEGYKDFVYSFYNGTPFLKDDRALFLEYLDSFQKRNDDLNKINDFSLKRGK